jgi:excisionase family DNA binding protein
MEGIKLSTTQVEPKCIRIKQFCDWYNVSRSTAYRLFERGEINPIRRGGIVLLDMSEVERWASSDNVA